MVLTDVVVTIQIIFLNNVMTKMNSVIVIVIFVNAVMTKC